MVYDFEKTFISRAYSQTARTSETAMVLETNVTPAMAWTATAWGATPTATAGTPTTSVPNPHVKIYVGTPVRRSQTMATNP